MVQFLPDRSTLHQPRGANPTDTTTKPRSEQTQTSLATSFVMLDQVVFMFNMSAQSLKAYLDAMHLNAQESKQVSF